MKPFFWGKPSSLLTHSPLTEKRIQAAEQELGYQLPAAYLAVLQEQNGGYINYRGYPAPSVNSTWGNTLPVEFIWGIGRNSGILDTPIVLELHHVPEGLVIFSGDTGFWLAMDYRSQRTYFDPPIVYIDLEAYNHTTEIADNFALFLANLNLGEPDHILGIIAPELDKTHLAEQINACWQISLALEDDPATDDSLMIYYHPEWRGNWFADHARFVLYANRNPDGDPIFPMYAEYNWLLNCDLVDAALMMQLESRLINCLPHQTVRLHTPFIEQTAET